MHDIKSYDSFQADRLEGSKPTLKKNIIYDILKWGILPNWDKVEILNKMGHVPLGLEDLRQDLLSLEKILRDAYEIFQHKD